MTKKIQVFIILCLSCLIGMQTLAHAQVKSKENTKEIFSKEEITAFSKTKIFIKKNPFDVEASLKKAVLNSDLPQKRFSEIFDAQFGGTDPKITPKEQLSLDKFKESAEKDKAEYDKKVKEFFTKQQISWDVYEKILNEYRSDTNFQRIIANRMQEIINQNK